VWEGKEGTITVFSCVPFCRPIGSGDRFCGVYHRPTQEVVLFERKGRGKVRPGGQAGECLYLINPANMPVIIWSLWAGAEAGDSVPVQLGQCCYIHHLTLCFRGVRDLLQEPTAGARCSQCRWFLHAKSLSGPGPALMALLTLDCPALTAMASVTWSP
jgi:hypothetical protein